MRTTSALKTAALLVAAVVLGLATVQGSLAVWNTTARAAAGTVQAADFAVTLKTGSAPAQRLSANGAPATVSLPAITGLKPGETRTIPVAVTNATDAGNGAFRIRLSTSTPTISGTAPAELRATAGLTTAGTCPGSALPDSVQLGQGATGTVCITVTLEAAAPATLGGKASGLGVRLTAVQL